MVACECTVILEHDIRTRYSVELCFYNLAEQLRANLAGLSNFHFLKVFLFLAMKSKSSKIYAFGLFLLS